MAEQVKINFMRLRFIFIAISACLVTFGIYIFVTSGESKYGVDFAGGAEVVINVGKKVSADEVRDALEGAGISGAIVQKFNEIEVEEAPNPEFSIRLAKGGEGDPSTLGDRVRDSLSSSLDTVVRIDKSEFVGPVIGEQIRRAGVSALAFALGGMLLYITFRFEWRFALGAIAALMHDVIITIGIYVFSGKQISAGVLAALLTIVGYSLNDTIIVFDRVRENLRSKLGKTYKNDYTTLVNISLNQTLSRTLLTSVTTLFVVSALWVLGGGAVQDLSFTLVIGVIVGTYSSIYVACTTLLLLHKK